MRESGTLCPALFLKCSVTIKTYLRDDENGLKEIITSMENDNGDVLCKLSTIWSKK